MCCYTIADTQWSFVLGGVYLSFMEGVQECQRFVSISFPTQKGLQDRGRYALWFLGNMTSWILSYREHITEEKEAGERKRILWHAAVQVRRI